MAKRYLEYNNKLVSLDGKLVTLDVATADKISEEKTVIPSTTQQIITPTDDEHELSKVTVNAIQTEEKTVIENGDVTPSDGKYLSKVTVNVPIPQPTPTQEKTANPMTSQQEITPDDGYNLSKVTINAVTSAIDENIQAQNIKKNVTILDVTGTLEDSNLEIDYDKSTKTLTISGETGGGSSGEWQPNADMVWAKEVCENDVGPTECKVLQMIGDNDITSSIMIPKNGYVKTSDGSYYEGSTSEKISVTHTWDDTNARITEGFKGVYEKVRWVITYYPANAPNVFPANNNVLEGYLKNVVYICYDNVNVVIGTGGLLGYLRSLIYVEGINNAIFKLCQSAFKYCSSLKGFSGITGIDSYFFTPFTDCTSLEKVEGLDTKNITTAQGMFYNCYLLKTIGSIDLRSATNVKNIVNNCYSLVNMTLKNIPVSTQIGSGAITSTAAYGYMLTLKSLLNTIKELWDNTGGTSTLTLTVGSANLAKLANVYVKLVDITDEMRAEDEFIDKKLPFEVCESVDEGAMLITDYALAIKNWEIQ